MTFIDFLSEKISTSSRTHTRTNSSADLAGTPHAEKYTKKQISNLEAAAKEARKYVSYKADDFRHKSIDDNKFGDPDLVALARKPEIDVQSPIDLIKKEMEFTKPKVDLERNKCISRSNCTRNKNGGKM